MNISDRLKQLLSINQDTRIAKDRADEARLADPKLLRYTTYQGDRKIQQLGQGIVENGVVLNNQAIKIGDPMLPLAKGNVLRRVDNTNGGALLGSAFRSALENDFDPNGNRRSSQLGRNGGDEPSDPFIINRPNNGGGLPQQFPPPFGCTPPPNRCIWTNDPVTPDGFQAYGSAVINENGLPLYLYCIAGTAVAKSLNCEFLRKWKCNNGVCTLDDNGTFDTQAECESVCAPISYGIIWNWVQSCRPGGVALPVEQKILYDDLLPTDSIVFTVTATVCFSDRGVEARNSRTGQRYFEFFGGSGDGFLSVGGASPSFSIVREDSTTGWLNP